MGLKVCIYIVAVLCLYLDKYGAESQEIPREPEEEFEREDARSIDEIIQDAWDHSPIQASAHPLLNNTVIVEGDILYTREEYEAMSKEEENGHIYNGTGLETRSTSESERKRWTNNIVPYVLDSSYTDEHKKVMDGVFADYHKYTCLKFKPQTDEENFIEFYDGGGCYSYVGMVGGNQGISLGSGCRGHGTAIHEVGHALGLDHQQSRPDRDSYVTVHFENIKDGKEGNFRKKSTTYRTTFGVAYDYGSVMHYGRTYFSKNGEPTIVTKDPNWEKMIGTNRDQGLSFGDLKILNIMYKCADHCGGKTCPNGGYLDKNCNCQCKGCSLQSCDGPGPFENLSCNCKDNGDLKISCAKRKALGKCGNWYWTDRHCPITCGICSINKGGSGNCKDLASDCSRMASKGFCDAGHSKYNCMSQKCKKTCGLC